MESLSLVSANNPILRQRARAVTRFDAELRGLTEALVSLMHQAGGVGLGAPQVGLDMRVAVAEHEGRAYRLINPLVVTESPNLWNWEEGCLSLPGIFGYVWRPRWLRVKTFDLKGRPNVIRVEGMLARIFAHEIDHLNGVLFVDKATGVRRVDPAKGGAGRESVEREAVAA